MPDALGSVRLMADQNGQIVLRQDYTPYGEVLRSEGTAETDFAFTGENYDAQTGLVFLRARYYNPAEGRFVSKDKWEGQYSAPLSFNKWDYGFNNPLSFIDPNGNVPKICLDGSYCGVWQPPRVPSELCYSTTGRDYLACPRVINGFYPNANISLGELMTFDLIGDDCYYLGLYQRSENLPLSHTMNSGDREEYGYWYHYLLENQRGFWNKNGTQPTSFSKVVLLTFLIEALKC